MISSCTPLRAPCTVRKLRCIRCQGRWRRTAPADPTASQPASQPSRQG